MMNGMRYYRLDKAIDGLTGIIPMMVRDRYAYWWYSGRNQEDGGKGALFKSAGTCDRSMVAGGDLDCKERIWNDGKLKVIFMTITVSAHK